MKKDRANKSPFSALSEEKQRRLKAAVQKANKAASELATEFGVSRNTIMYHAKKNNVKLPRLAGPRKATKRGKKKKA